MLLQRPEQPDLAVEDRWRVSGTGASCIQFHSVSN